MTHTIKQTLHKHITDTARLSNPLLLLLLLLTIQASATQAATIQASAIHISDDNNQQLTLTKPARRIISLAPHITELLYSAGAGQYIVGTISHSDYPSDALKIPRIGDNSGLDMEAILNLRPDLIIAWPSGNPKSQLHKLKQLGINIYNAEPRQLDDIPRTIEQLGQLTATTAQAKRSAQNFRHKLEILRQKYRALSPVRVFFQIWEQPLITVNGQHLISDVIQLCSGQNIFSELTTLAPQVNIEAVLQANPEAIITSAGSNTDITHGENQQPASLQHWNQWTDLSASRNGHLYGIQPAHISRHTARILLGTQRLCEQLQGVRQRPDTTQ